MKSDAMKALKAHGDKPPWGRRLLIVAGVVVLVAVVAGVAYVVGKRATPTTGASSNGANNSTTAPARDVAPLVLVSSSPAAGAPTVASNASITLKFSKPIFSGSALPSLVPPVSGTWAHPTPTTLQYEPAAPLIPFTHEVVTVPGGVGGVRGRNGSALRRTASIGFTVSDGSFLRLQQLLAELDYLPLTFTPSGAAPAARDQAQAQPGALTWRWSTLPAVLTTQWIAGYENVITKAAVMSFENQSGLTVDGLAGPSVWSTLLNDVAMQKDDPSPYTYVVVSKTLPENLTLYNNGAAQYTNIPVNTGAPGADTVDGTYPVFEHVTSSRMVGTNPDGSTYDDPAVPWASFFNGGDALHGFVRATYGSPQSNGCVEMTIADAQMLWPLTPIGTLVTVVGPPVT
jgi:lipoprotein-anchoring transpeptidase ErfK/SrfK